MGVLNLTPDSFSDGGRWADPRAALEHALRMAEDGADIVDIGGESTRPGARAISPAEELDRVVPLIEKLRSRSDVAVSIARISPAPAAAWFIGDPRPRPPGTAPAPASRPAA